MVHGWALLTVVSMVGCTVGGGPVVGYGTKRGAFAGVAASTGITVAQGTVEADLSADGAVLQLRGDGAYDKPRARLSNGLDPGTYWGGRVGLGAAWHDGDRTSVMLAGPSLVWLREHRTCEQGIPMLIMAIDVRFLMHETEVALAPRYEYITGCAGGD